MAGLGGLKKRRRVQIIALFLVAVFGAAGLMGYAMRDGINYFRTPTEVAKNPPPPSEVFRIGGLVERGSLVRGSGATITFRVTDTNQTVEVRYTGVLPDLFAEGTGMVGTGHMEGSVFVAENILAKHDENYKPKEVIDALKAQGIDVAPSVRN